MSTVTQGSFQIDATGAITIGDGQADKNKIIITITNNGAATKVKVTMTVTCGTTGADLLDTNTAPVTGQNVTGTKPLTLTSSEPSDDSRAWETPANGVQVAAGQKVLLQLSGFNSKTPPGDALIDVIVQTRQGVVWSPAPADIAPPNRVLSITKPAPPPKGDPKVHYFVVNPEFLLHAGRTPVTASFYATRFSRITLFRNNQEVQNWTSESGNTDGILTGEFDDLPSLTTVYRLEGIPIDAGQKTVLYRTVQVISPGWNQIALPQGYPAQLFVNTDFSGSGMDRLYGIFIDPTGKTDAPVKTDRSKAALYSSATGVDDWRAEPGDVPQNMRTSPGVAYDNKLWLVGGSSVYLDNPSSAVWCYEPDGEERRWNKKEDFPTDMGARAGHACVLVRGKTPGENEIWVLGGYNNGTFLGDVWKLEGGKTWRQIIPTGTMWPARYRHAAVSFTPAANQATEVWIFGGIDSNGLLADIWFTKDRGSTWQPGDQIMPPPGKPFGATLVSFASLSGTNERLFLGGTFLEPATSGNANRTSSFIFERQWRNKIWEARPVVDGWQRFEGSRFYMQAVAFNSFLFVWSLHAAISEQSVPKLNILIS